MKLVEKILFLDIDGVLNDHAFCEVSQSCTIKPQCMAYLNSILHETHCQIVLTSAWRYIYHGGDMTLRGFEYMLRTHGLLQRTLPIIVGATDKDRDTKEPRAEQVKRWLSTAATCNGWGLEARVFRWAILDDLDLGFTDCPECQERFVRTNGESGLNHISAMQTVEVLNTI